jgi:hypothetical protein
MTDSNTHSDHTEEFKVSGEGIVSKIKEIIKEGNARRIILKNEHGEVLMEIPLTFAVVGTVLAPILAAVGALAALVAELSITVVKKTPKDTKET